jgi:hypothetical protein
MTIGKLWKALGLGIGLCVFAGAQTARAQTVWVRHATPGAPAELMLNANKVASGTADATGNVSLTVTPAPPKDKETDAHLYLESCGNLRRVLIVDVGATVPAPDSACRRTAVPDLFRTYAITTFVVDAAPDNQSVLITQGPAFDEWLHPVVDEQGNLKSIKNALPRGLMVTAGATGLKYGNVFAVACGTAPTCSDQQMRLAPTVGATYWIFQFLAVEGTFTKPTDVQTTGSGTNYNFTSVFRARMVTVDGKIGYGFGPIRLYGIVGETHTNATASTTQITVASATGQGGTETFELKTAGWGLMYGGGIEGWFGDRLALYAEGGRASLNGAALNNGDGSLSDNMIYATLGVRFRLGL